MTFMISFGAYGGFYLYRSNKSFRLCLGWIAFTILFEDIDTILNNLP